MIMERYADYEQQISVFLENMDENDYMQSFLYFVDYIENELIQIPETKKETDEDGQTVIHSATRESEGQKVTEPDIDFKLNTGDIEKYQKMKDFIINEVTKVMHLTL